MVALILLDDTEKHLVALGELLHQKGNMALPAFFGASEDPVADRQCGAAAFFLDPDLWCGSALFFPFFGDADRFVAVNLDDLEHGYLRQAAHLMQGPPQISGEQSFLGHVLEQSLEGNLVRPSQSKGF